MDAERVLDEAAHLGLTALEAGPDGFLPGEPEEMASLLSQHGLELVGGFVPAVLHRPQARDSELASVERQAKLFAAAGAGVLVIAAATGEEGYEESAGLGDSEWAELFATLAMVEEIGTKHGLSVVLHPHYGTEIESPEHVQRFLEGCDTALCLDTGHSMVGGGDPVVLTESAASRIRHVHLKDVDRDLAERVLSDTLPYEQAVRDGLYMPLGDGDVDVRRVLEVLDEEGYDGWYVLEQDIMLSTDPGYGPAAEVGRSLAYLDGVLEQ
ncbi:MAG TPA: TIM barrel protein [Rubrobacter sp.]|nr:TIM barrel protein [Rubrobacter sp.]